jgi:hypothetical protein
MKTATINVTLSISGDGINRQEIPLASWQSTNSPAFYQLLPLNSGDNTITLPVSPSPLGGYCLILLPAGVTAKWKGVDGDSGYSMGTTGGLLMIPLNESVPGSFVINVSGQCVAPMWIP